MAHSGPRRPPISRRTFLATAGAAAAVGGLAPYARAATPKTIRFLNGEADPDTVQALQEIAAEWKQKTDVTVVVETVPLDQMYPKIAASIKAGRPYDIGTLAFIGHVILLAREGHLAPLTPLIDRIGRRDFGPRILFPWKNDVWWFPYDYNFAMMFIRKDWLAEKKLPVPTSWAQWIEVSRALTEPPNRYGLALPIGNGGATSFLSTGVFWGNDVHVFDDKWNVVLDAPAMKPRVVEALRTFEQLYATMPPGMVQASWGEALSLFVSEKVAASSYAGRMIHHIEKYGPKLVDKYALAGFPSKDGKKPAVTFGYDGWILMKGEHQKEAFDFLAWLATERLVKFLHTLALHYQPAQYSLYTNPAWRNHPLLERHRDALAVMRSFLDPDRAWINSIDTDGPEMDPRPGKVWEANVFPEMLQDVCLKKVPAERAVTAAADKVRKLLQA
jgi:multiple sugar transport system substrate-binding protein